MKKLSIYERLMLRGMQMIMIYLANQLNYGCNRQSCEDIFKDIKNVLEDD